MICFILLFQVFVYANSTSTGGYTSGSQGTSYVTATLKCQDQWWPLTDYGYATTESTKHVYLSVYLTVYSEGATTYGSNSGSDITEITIRVFTPGPATEGTSGSSSHYQISADWGNWNASLNTTFH